LPERGLLNGEKREQCIRELAAVKRGIARERALKHTGRRRRRRSGT